MKHLSHMTSTLQHLSIIQVSSLISSWIMTSANSYYWFTVYPNAPIYKHINPLAVPTIIIHCTGAAVACSTKPPWSMVEHVGRGLQRILKHEYGDIYEIGSGITDPATVMRSCNPPLSKYTLFNALQRLRQQFKSYINAEDPFNHKLWSNQSSLQ